jgi:hypothetical protein
MLLDAASGKPCALGNPLSLEARDEVADAVRGYVVACLESVTSMSRSRA